MRWKLLFRNDECYMDCAVCTFLLHAYTSGLVNQGKGPIFGNFDAEGKLLVAHELRVLDSNPRDMAGKPVKVWFTADGKRVNMDSKRISDNCVKMFRMAGLPQCTCHTWRVMMTILGACSGKDLYDVIWIGDWAMSDSSEWLRYFTLGQRLFKVHKAKGETNPISKIYPLPPYSIDATKHGINPPVQWIQLAASSGS